eukprot:CAMPEP_0197045700 /NCGR_PEP_ID=MMETSP1384-20130603/21506_1 /TAXON_ID=29189 /ORGANISM="Ammonia sp." /LENGTH=865 /DNA_ID=CAMNT_0042477355 /DNA_START=40 /DNA_END=2637 /DNA_ORIENTATION=+
MTSPSPEITSLLQEELSSADSRYLSLRTKLHKSLSSDAELLQYVQYIEDKLSCYKKRAVNLENKKHIQSAISISPSISLSPSRADEDRVAVQSKPTRHRLDSVTIINSIEQFNEILAQNDDNVNSQIFDNLKLYQDFVCSLSGGFLTMESFLSSMCSVLQFSAASIYSISHSLEKISCELSTLPHITKKYSTRLNEGILSTIVKHKRRIIVQDVDNSEFFKFNHETDDRLYALHQADDRDSDDSSVHYTKTVCLEPLFNEEKEMVGILELVHTEPKSQDYANKVFLTMLEVARNVASTLLSNALLQRDCTNSNIHNQALLQLAKVMSNTDSENHKIEAFVEKVRDTIYKLVKCDKVALFMVDEIRQELWCSASDDVAGIRIPMGAGIVGHTVTTGEVLNIPDAYQDSRFNRSVDIKTNYRTKEIVCVPIKYNDKVIGAMECMNKLTDEPFNETDESLLIKVAGQLAPSLQNKFMESALRIISHGLQDSTSRDYLLQFMHSEENVLSPSTSSASSDRNVSNKRKRVISHFSNPQMYVSRMSDSSNKWRAEVDSWDFDYFKLLEDNYQTAIPMMVYMFNDCGLLSKFNIPEQKLFSFLIACKQHYYDNPYHNFLHAFSVMHVCYLLMKHTAFSQHFNQLDVLTILISAVCHDLEHPGLTNAYQVNSGSDLAIRYNDKSVLENHHAHIGSVLLKKPEMAILNGLSSEERNKVRRGMINIILHTDMSYHQDIVTKLHQLNTKKNKEDENKENAESVEPILCEAVVHMGDLSNPLMNWSSSCQWGLRVIDEFVAQSKLEKEQGLKESMSFIKDKSAESVSKVQVSFIDYVVKPLWKNAAFIAPELEARLSVLDENKNHWLQYAEQSTLAE